MSKTNHYRVHPTYREMIHAAIKAHKRYEGSSRQEIFKYITSYYKLKEQVTSVRYYLKLALKAGVQDGSLKQTRGTGANGVFRLAKTSKQNCSKIAPAKKKTTGEKSPSVSIVSDGLQNMPLQQLNSETLAVPKTLNSNKSGDLQSAHAQNNALPEIQLQNVNLSENSVTHKDSITSVNSPNSLSTPDSGIGNLPENCLMNNVNSLETFTSPAALQDIGLPKNINAEVSINNVELKPSKKYCFKGKKKDISKPSISTEHPIIPEYAPSRKNCKFCYSTLGIVRKCYTRCYTCETHLCFNIKRNCLLESHKA